jgi:hypothetical protein
MRGAKYCALLKQIFQGQVRNNAGIRPTIAREGSKLDFVNLIRTLKPPSNRTSDVNRQNIQSNQNPNCIIRATSIWALTITTSYPLGGTFN